MDYLNSQKEKISVPVSNSVVVDNNSSSGKLMYHKIRSGESIGLIADKYGTTITNIKKWNHLHSNVIQAGKTLKIYSNGAELSSVPVNKGSSDYYTVQRGDSLFSIARKFPGVSAENLKKWNDISGDNIQPGMKLKING